MYTSQQEAVYLIELVLISLVLFGYGFWLLGSTRKKDQAYKMYGWIAYGLSFGVIAIMAVLISHFTKG